MKAIRFHEYGSPDVLRVDDVDVPVPGAGEVRIRVAGTTFNSVDGNIRAGLMQGPMPLTLPHIPGLDVAGTVDVLGAGVGGLSVGDRVVGFLPFVTPGAAAEFTIARADAVTAAPTTIPLADAAALPLVGLTAWQGLFEYGELAAGQRVLINGAGGAVGHHAVQLARAAGAHVIATAGARSSRRVREAGAHEIVDHTAGSVVTAVTDPVDMVFNLAPVDPDELTALAGLVVDGGVVVSTTVWMPAPSDDRRGVRGVDMYVRNDPDDLRRLVDLVDGGELDVLVTERVPLEALGSIHARAGAGDLTGKVVVIPSQTDPDIPS